MMIEIDNNAISAVKTIFGSILQRQEAVDERVGGHALLTREVTMC